MKRLKPMCDGRWKDTKGNRVECPNIGVPVWVAGSFDRSPQKLCPSCVEMYARMGWKVTYQLGGGKPNAANTEGS